MDQASEPQQAQQAQQVQRPPPAQPKIDPKIEAVVFRDPRSQLGDIGVIGFYFPDREEDCDKICGAGFLGNFWETPEKIRLTAKQPGPAGAESEHEFRNAEAAFQALKFWNFATEFEQLTGDDAFFLKRQNQGFEDFSYGGKGDNWKGMRAVLDAKFAPESAMAEAICKTGDTFLLEHNSVKGRDDTWSNNSDGEGKNWLGLQLMLIRDKLTGNNAWTDFAGGLLNLDNGAPHNSLKGKKWQDAVRSATQALMVKVDEIRPRVPCARVGCGKPAWNNQPGEYCSKDCRKTICSRYGCGKPSWNGKQMEYCSHACRQADNLYWMSPTYGSSYGASGGTYNTYNTYSTYGGPQTASGSTYNTHSGAHGVAGGAQGAHIGSQGMSAGTHGAQQSGHGAVGMPYGTSAVGTAGVGAHGGSHGAAVASQAAPPSICKTPGCGKPTWNGRPHEYCSRACKDTTLGRAGVGAPIAGGLPPSAGAPVGGGPGGISGAGSGAGAAGTATAQQQPAMPGSTPAGPVAPVDVGAQPKKKRWGLW